MEKYKKETKNKEEVDPFKEIMGILDEYDKGNPPRTTDDYETCC